MDNKGGKVQNPQCIILMKVSVQLIMLQTIKWGNGVASWLVIYLVVLIIDQDLTPQFIGGFADKAFFLWQVAGAMRVEYGFITNNQKYLHRSIGQFKGSALLTKTVGAGVSAKLQGEFPQKAQIWIGVIAGSMCIAAGPLIIKFAWLNKYRSQFYFSDRINQTSLKSFRLRSASYDPTGRPGRLDRQDITIPNKKIL